MICSPELAEQLTESAYYKALGRLCGSGFLNKAGKGVYYRPKYSRFGIVPLPETAILQHYTEGETGMLVGYALYRELGLTTQIPKSLEAYSSRMEQQTKTIRNVRLTRYPLKYSVQVRQMIALLEILQNYYEIQDLNSARFLEVCSTLVKKYNDETFDEVMQVIRYPKRTIAFLKSILDHYGIPNHLRKYLSGLSDYHYPRMEELYEIARLPR